MPEKTTDSGGNQSVRSESRSDCEVGSDEVMLLVMLLVVK